MHTPVPVSLAVAWLKPLTLEWWGKCSTSVLLAPTNYAQMKRINLESLKLFYQFWHFGYFRHLNDILIFMSFWHFGHCDILLNFYFLTSHFDKSFWQVILTSHFDKSFWQVILTSHFDKSFWQVCHFDNTPFRNFGISIFNNTMVLGKMPPVILLRDI